MADNEGIRDVKREIGDYVHRQNSIKRLRKSGMIFPKQVNVPDEFIDKGGNLVIPEDVSEIPTEELGRYLSIFSALGAYYEAVVACSDIDYVTSSRVLDYIEAKVLLDVGNKPENRKTSVTEKKAMRDLDNLVIKAQDWKDATESNFKLSAALLKGIDRIIFLLSREITRRGFRHEVGERLIDMGYRPKPPSV